MNIPKHYFITIIILFFTFFSYSQIKDVYVFSNINESDFLDTNYNSGDAVIIADIGSLNFVGNKYGFLSYQLKSSKRIKINNKRAFDEGTVSLEFYISDDGKEEEIKNIQGKTFNLVNGKVEITELKKEEIILDKFNKNLAIYKFTMPALIEGSIIEYSYEKISPYIRTPDSWTFQDAQYKTIWSDFTFTQPDLVLYNKFETGTRKYHLIQSDQGTDRYFIVSRTLVNPLVGEQNNSVYVTSKTNIVRWVMKDVPPFEFEPFVSSYKNYVERITFQEYKYYNGQSYQDVLSSWDDFQDELIKSESFGQLLYKPNFQINKLLKSIIDNPQNNIEDAKLIYTFLQNNFNVKERNSIYLNDDIKEILETKNINDAGINLLLTSLLIQAGFKANPVILSTKSNGVNNAIFPEKDKFNHVISLLRFNNQKYYLDCSNKFLAFGKLPLNLYNGHIRVIDPDFSYSDSLNSTDIISSSNGYANLVIEENQIKGTFEKKVSDENTLRFRSIMFNDGVSKLELNIKEKLSESYTYDSISINGNEQNSNPISFKINLISKDTVEDSLLIFQPIIDKTWLTNDFNAPTRINPINFPSKINDVYTVKVKIPDGYEVVELGNSVRIKLFENSGQFTYLISKENNEIIIQIKFILKDVYFLPIEYEGIKDFFEKINQKLKENIVIKKTI